MKILRWLVSLAVLVALAIGGVYVYRGCSDGTLSMQAMPVYAASNEAEDSPIKDLQNDPNFKLSDFPYVENDKSLQVLQIAENKDGGLFVYVYHAGGLDDKRALALHINMSVTRVSNQSTGHNLYKLTPASGEKTIQKYAVDGYKVKSDVVRYYDIASITRTWIAGVDEEAGGDNTITEKSFPVGQLWMVAGFGNAVEYSMVKQDVVEVTSKYVASVRYYSPEVHNHIIAFSTDRSIDTLYEVELIYTKQYVETQMDTIISKGAQIDVTETIAADHKDSVVTANGKKTVYSWEKIQTAEAYCTAEKTVLDASVPSYSFNAGVRENVQKHNWVIRFLTTSYDAGLTGGARPSAYMNYTRVLDTCILRLKFEEDGQVYDLGAVDDVQSPAQPSDKTYSGSGSLGFGKWLSKFGKFLKKVFVTIWNVFAAPFKFVQKHWQVFLVVAGVLLLVAVVIPLIRWILGK